MALESLDDQNMSMARMIAAPLYTHLTRADSLLSAISAFGRNTYPRPPLPSATFSFFGTGKSDGMVVTTRISEQSI